MDNSQLKRVIDRIGVLKNRYTGSYPADLMPETIQPNTFCIINTDLQNQDGTHWLLFAKRGNVVYFVDSLGRRLTSYRNLNVNFDVEHLVEGSLHRSDFCGLYCIYFAYIVFTKPTTRFVNDFHIARFFTKYL